MADLFNDPPGVGRGPPHDEHAVRGLHRTTPLPEGARRTLNGVRVASVGGPLVFHETNEFTRYLTLASSPPRPPPRGVLLSLGKAGKGAARGGAVQVDISLTTC